MSEAAKAKKSISKDNVDLKVALEGKVLNEVVNNLRGAIMICYPAYHGLPEWEPVR